MTRSVARVIWGLLLAAWLVGCSSGQLQPSPGPTPLPSTWSRPLALAETSSAGAPAMVMTASGWAIAWAENSALNFAVIDAGGIMRPAQTVILGRAPWNLTLLPTPGGEWHLLWQDTDRLGEVRLYSALLDPDGTLSRGPLLVAADPITEYAAAVGADGTAALIWADSGPRPQLFGRAIDAAGRPAAAGPQKIAGGATLPALVAVEGGGWRLAWLQRPASPHTPDTLFDVMLLASSTNLPWEDSHQPLVIGHVVLEGPVEYVERLSLGLDMTTGYILAITRNAGTGQSSTSLLSFDQGPLIPLPAQHPLMVPSISAEDTVALDTGFHTTAVAVGPIQADKSMQVVGWSAEADGQRPFLPVALDAEGELKLAYFQQGNLVGVESTGLDAGLMHWPVLVVDSARDLSLAWVVQTVEPGGSDRIWMITTRPTDPDS